MNQDDGFFYTVKTAAGLAAFINRTCEGGTYREFANELKRRRGAKIWKLELRFYPADVVF